MLDDKDDFGDAPRPIPLWAGIPDFVWGAFSGAKVPEMFGPVIDLGFVPYGVDPLR